MEKSPYTKSNSSVGNSCIPWQPIDIISLAVAYVPNQKICNYYDEYTALMLGTAFPALTGLYIYNFIDRKEAEK